MTTQDIYHWLEEVKDPEIPVLSLVDLGVITKVDIEDKHVSLIMTPTFVGCPALDMMKEDVTQTLLKHGAEEVTIQISYNPGWSSDRISEKGKAALKKFGLAPPPQGGLIEDIEMLEHAICPRCSGTNTELKSAFGATLCRSIYYCHDCRESFEQFKAL